MSSHKNLWVHLATVDPDMTSNRPVLCRTCIIKRSAYIPLLILLFLLVGTYLSAVHRTRLSFIPKTRQGNCTVNLEETKESVYGVTTQPLLKNLHNSFKFRRLENIPSSNQNRDENSLPNVLTKFRFSDPSPSEDKRQLIVNSDESVDNWFPKSRYDEPINDDQSFSSTNRSPDAQGYISSPAPSSERAFETYFQPNNLIFPKRSFKRFDKWKNVSNVSVNYMPQLANLPFSEKIALWKSTLPYRSKDVDLMAQKPLPFLGSYKNPCWLENSRANYSGSYYTSRVDVSHELAVMQGILEKRHKTGDFHRVRCLPYFFIIGQPKCGSTDLYRKLIAHPDVCNIPPALKEPHWWTRARLGRQSALGHVVSLRSYVDLFDYAAYRIETETRRDENGDIFHNKITGEGSMSTFWDNDHWWAMVGNENTSEPRVLNPDNLHHVLPDTKLILILRNPTQRMYSDFLYFRKDRKLPLDFHNSVVNAIRVYRTCLQVHTARACAYNATINLRAKIRLRVGMYSVFLADWLRVFPRKQLFIVRTEDYADNPHAILRNLYTFLGLRSLGVEEEESILSMQKANTRRKQDVKIGDMLPETRVLLNAFYKPYNEQLARMLGDKSFLWQETWS